MLTRIYGCSSYSAYHFLHFYKFCFFSSTVINFITKFLCSLYSELNPALENGFFGTSIQSITSGKIFSLRVRIMTWRLFHDDFIPLKVSLWSLCTYKTAHGWIFLSPSNECSSSYRLVLSTSSRSSFVILFVNWHLRSRGMPWITPPMSSACLRSCRLRKPRFFERIGRCILSFIIFG